MNPTVTRVAVEGGFTVEVHCPETNARFKQEFSPYVEGLRPLTAEEADAYTSQVLQQIADYKAAIAAAEAEAIAAQETPQ